MINEGRYHYNLAALFESVADRWADRPALWLAPDRSVSYRDLNSQANRIARLFRDRGLRPGEVVCISGEKTPGTFAALLACLKLGCPYAVLDPDSPADRLTRILSTCRPRLIVTDDAGKVSLASGTQGVPVGALPDLASSLPDVNLEESARVTGGSPAYVMYTSGSTGMPKGAVISHANVINLISWAQATYGIRPSDIATNVNPLFFDNSVFDLYTTLFSGACLVPFSKQETRDPELLVDKVSRAACNQWFSVPSLLIFLQAMKATSGAHLSSIRRFIFGGEGYPKAKLKQLFDVYAGQADLFNVYGPTECTCICSSYRLEQRDFDELEGYPPLGRIAENFSFLILDGDHPVRPGGAGELCLLGPNVGLGYFNAPEETARSFVQNPLNDSFREIMYRTGDLVRMDPGDGRLYILGRLDNQIKHMGYRIELEEIETALSRLAYVTEAVALHGANRGIPRIIAVVALSDATEDDRLRADLAHLLPSYMIPTIFHRELSLPKNANGKVDRRALSQRYLA